MLAPWERHQPTGLEKHWCPYCQGNFTYALGRCTSCIRKEENRKQGVIYLICGGFMAIVGALAVIFSSGVMFRMCAAFMFFTGAGITWKGFRAVVLGISADGPM